jgi:Na+-transporting NADH:ubiquinone oxidoreductase subunit C
MSEKSFKDSMLYPVLFMLVVSIVFVGLLAVMYRSSEAKIQAYKKDSYQKMVLGLFAEKLSEVLSTKPYYLINDYPGTFNSYIKETTLSGLDRRVFVATVDSTVLGYCIDIGGKGLWGTMRALVAMSPDFKTMQGLAIYEQMETPGLGARIGEDWFLSQFNHIPIIKTDGKPGDYVSDFEFIPEGQTASNPKQIRQITGATITSSSVIRMLKDEINLAYSAFLGQVKP